MPDLIPGVAAWRRARVTWRQWTTLDPLTREYECERAVRGIALGLVLSFALWAALWLLWRLT